MREVGFVADEDEADVRACEGADVVEKRLQGAEGCMRRHVVNEQCASGAAVVGARHGPEALGASRVPELC